MGGSQNLKGALEASLRGHAPKNNAQTILWDDSSDDPTEHRHSNWQCQLWVAEYQSFCCRCRPKLDASAIASVR